MSELHPAFIIFGLYASVIFLLWSANALDLYFIWRDFDSRFGTDYRFNKGDVPEWLSSLLKRLER